jgi:2-keto-4-pentenoate hydratase/2-oxohepta-3-ene-1,7-dioic acid hydratase in catechol pathway
MRLVSYEERSGHRAGVLVGQDIVLPTAHPEFVDYEAELAIVIGRTAREVEWPRHSST